MDSGALRTRRSRFHKAGDHSLCLLRNCPDAPPGILPPGNPPAASQDAVRDPVAELRLLARNLAWAYQSDPGNALLARELRMTLQALMPKTGTQEDSDLADLFAEFGAS